MVRKPSERRNRKRNTNVITWTVQEWQLGEDEITELWQLGKVTTVGTVSSHHSLPNGLHNQNMREGERIQMKYEHLLEWVNKPFRPPLFKRDSIVWYLFFLLYMKVSSLEESKREKVAFITFYFNQWIKDLVTCSRFTSTKSKYNFYSFKKFDLKF